MIRLKQRKGNDAYDKLVCAASRCNEVSAVIDATHKIAKVDVPLCDRHNAVRFAEPEPRIEAPAPVVRLHGLSKKELAGLCLKHEIPWDVMWSKKQARIALRKHLRGIFF